MTKSQKGTATKFILNCVDSRETDNDWLMASAEEAGLVAAAPIPKSKDLRKPWWTIGQQDRTGSCVGWAVADSALRWHFVRARRLLTTERLSVRYLWMAAKETDTLVTRPTTFIESDGTSLKAALDIVRKLGIVKASILPFSSGKLYRGKVSVFYALAAQRRITSYFNLEVSPKNWRAWIARNGPVLARLDVDATWDNAATTRGNLDAYQASTKRGGHAIALVGYTTDRFIVRNSWGTQWGDKGFGYATDAYATAAFTEAYGVVP